jgi:hypothetical protein
LLERSPSEIPYLLMAQEAGAGLADYTKLNPLRMDLRA